MATLDSVYVRDYMNTEPVTFTPEMEVMLAVNQLVGKKIGGAPVVDKQGELIGMLSEVDCLHVGLVASQDSCVAGPVRQYMSDKIVSVPPEMNLMQLAGLFLNKPYRRYPVVENGKLVGQISRSDVLRAISDICG